MKRKSKRSLESGRGPDGAVPAAGDYVVGQVAGSLRRGARAAGGGGGRLAALFGAAAAFPPARPSFVPAPRETSEGRKREEDGGSTSSRPGPASRQPAKRARAKTASDADRNLAGREQALASADLEEETRQNQAQKKKTQSSAKVLDRKVLDDVDKKLDIRQRKKIQVNQEEERLKNERTVFVGNLPVTCNKKIPAEGTLSKKLAAIKRKVHPDQKTVNAYVVFKEESAAAKALKRNGAQIADGFRIRVDRASETSSRDKRSVFVGNLPYKVEERALEEHFLDCGSVVAVRIVRDPVTGVGKGFGYVLFENTDAVHLALKLNNSELMGRKLRVMRSVNKEKLRQNSNAGLKSISKPKQGFNFASTHARQSNSVFVGEKAVLIKKKKKEQKKSVQIKKPRKQKS
ncbi:RNA-binding protein 34 isoform X2 [Dipodomys merriami]|uniref:RNA-binding protein 34 isoform X2 n=1 Tax=Dipodomys merriami TaxID=94247 RepID=UPI003855C016